MSHHIPNCKPVHTDQNLNGFPLRSVLVPGYKYYYSKMTAHSSSTPHPQKVKNKQVIHHRSLVSAMASVSSGSRDCHQGEASLGAGAREISRLAAIAANMSRCTVVPSERSRRAAEAEWRTRRAIDAADWSGHAAEAEEMSSRATNAAEMSSRVAAAWEIFRGQARTLTGACVPSSLGRWIISLGGRGCRTT